MRSLSPHDNPSLMNSDVAGDYTSNNNHHPEEGKRSLFFPNKSIEQKINESQSDSS